MIFDKKENGRMLPYDTDALASKLGHNSGTEKVVRTKCETYEHRQNLMPRCLAILTPQTIHTI
jgi:hypothetical protein